MIVAATGGCCVAGFHTTGSWRRPTCIHVCTCVQSQPDCWCLACHGKAPACDTTCMGHLPSQGMLWPAGTHRGLRLSFCRLAVPLILWLAFGERKDCYSGRRCFCYSRRCCVGLSAWLQGPYKVPEVLGSGLLCAPCVPLAAVRTLCAPG